MWQSIKGSSLAAASEVTELQTIITILVKNLNILGSGFLLNRL